MFSRKNRTLIIKSEQTIVRGRVRAHFQAKIILYLNKKASLLLKQCLCDNLRTNKVDLPYPVRFNGQSAGRRHQSGAITKEIMVAKTGDDFELIKSPLNEDFDEKSENKSAVYDQKVVER